MRIPVSTLGLGAGDMRDLDREPYRGLGVRVRVHEEESHSFPGSVARYSVTWYLHKEGRFVSANVIATCTESVGFGCLEQAVSYAEQRAHTFADCTFAAVAMRG
jgi:hypothetical protein